MLWNQDEHTLLARMQAGEPAAVGELYDLYAGMLYGLAYRITRNRADAEEVTLDAFTQAWQQADRYDPARGGVSAWLITIARTRALDRRRRQPAYETNLEPWAALPFAETPESKAAQAEQAQQLRTLLNRLPANQRQVLVLAFYQGMTHYEIATHLGEPLGTVKTRARSGLQKLRAWLQTSVSSDRRITCRIA